MKPYFEQAGIAIYLGDARDILPRLDLAEVGAVVTDPPYGSTSLAWDRWPTAWPIAVASAVPDAATMWCFGTFRMFWDHRDEFNGAGWKLAQDLIWEKHNGSGFSDGRFNRVHEQPVQFYRGSWGAAFKAPQFTMDSTARQVRSKKRPAHRGNIERTPYVSEDGGPRLMRSVLRVPSVHGDADVYNETQKPIGIVEPLLRYSLRPGSMLLDPFCGAGTSLVVAKQLGARAIGIDVREDQCEAAARRLTQALRFGLPPTSQALSPTSEPASVPDGVSSESSAGSALGTHDGDGGAGDLLVAADTAGQDTPDETGTTLAVGWAARETDGASGGQDTIRPGATTPDDKGTPAATKTSKPDPVPKRISIVFVDEKGQEVAS